jgi:hypothetical protein
LNYGKVSFGVLAALAILSLFTAPISSSVAFLGGTGDNKIVYTQGIEPVISVRFDLPHDLALALSDVKVAGWNAVVQDDSLVISGGQLQPGQTLDIQYKITKYVPPGTTNLQGTFTTSSGKSISAMGTVTVTETVYLLWFFSFLEQLTIPLFLCLLPALVLWKKDWIKGKLRPVEAEIETNEDYPKDESVPIGNPPQVHQANEDKPPTTPPEKTTVPKRKITKKGIDITMCPKGWLPQGTNIVEFTARTAVCVDGKWEFPGEDAYITFELHEVSKMKGVCMNFGSGFAPDLWFPMNGNVKDPVWKEMFGNFTPFEFECDSANCPEKILDETNPPHQHVRKVKTKKREHEVKVTVRCEDFGAWGWIEAHADDHVQMPPREPDSPFAACPGGVCCEAPKTASKEEKPAFWVQIPRDKNNNHIADDTEQDECGSNVLQDEDLIPIGDKTAGDGLTAYEEYRGFIVHDPEGGSQDFRPRHIRTSIKTKDIFVYVVEGEHQSVLSDAVWNGYFKETGLEVHLILENKYINQSKPLPIDNPDSRRINCDCGYGHGGDQHAIALRVDEKIGEHVAKACGQPGAQMEQILKQYEEDKKAGKVTKAVVWTPKHWEMPGTPKMISHVCIRLSKCQDHPNRLKQVVAHELAHAVNVAHHGEVPKGAETQTHPHKDTNHGSCTYDLAGGITSGDPTCVMRYDSVGDGWCVVTNGKHTWHKTYTNDAKERLSGPGTKFCSTKQGSDVTEDKNNGIRNDASEGNCKSQLRVKDW